MIKAILCGAAGRMGREIINAIEGASDIKIIAGVEEKSNPFVNRFISSVKIVDDIQKVITEADCVIDFTNPGATMENLRNSARFKKPYCIGTTGFTPEQIAEIKKFSQEFPIFFSPNMSMGINVLYNLVEKVTQDLSEYDIEIIETHHRGKKDAPSGTAQAIGERIKKVKPDAKLIYGRQGMTGEREKKEICISAIRGGDVVGEHRILFLGQGEFIELRHFATSRRCFAEGTLKAIRFIVKKKKGFYTMSDLLG
uniref:4-hydroxy-tetrahydrodipicolinate reductase n=1 Tax=candidate division WOR-3 bacterium TaxID=2052148 RepID=A0A7C4TBC9_UNCW3